jgi:Fe(3+) dicitrate transport protein
MSSSCSVCRAGAFAVTGLLFVSPVVAQESSTESNQAPPILRQVDVIGDASGIYSIPGSAHFISEQDIREYSYDDINRVLRQVPGVYIREEDGYGLFPNISLRGVSTTRSSNVTIMEDGVLATPAPYAAPSVYYSPTTGRMSGLEVLKGGSQVKYGPHTTGGAINYLSTQIPLHRRTFLRGQFGSDNEYRTHAYHGDTVDTQWGRFGYLAEFYLRDTEGFKSIDAAPGFNDTDRTGFTNIEPMVKLAWEPNSPMYQRFEFKYGYTDRDADETYLGLTTADFRRDPYRRYSASRFDNIETEQHRTYLRHFISPTENFDLVTTAYYNEFSRSWFKLHDIRNVGGVPGTVNLSRALAGGGDPLACLQGQLACTLNVRDNNRSYYSAGIQSEGTLRFDTGVLNHELKVGIRYHADEEDRFQNETRYEQAGNGAITGVTVTPPGSQDNRTARANAIAVHVQDRIEFGDWWVTPGFRYENLSLRNIDRRPGNEANTGRTSLDLFGGGVGAGYNITDEWQAFSGVHFGFSPPSPGGAVVNDLKEETSIGYEVGTRYARRDGVLAAELVGFLTQFDDLIVVSNIGGTGTGLDENFGKVDAYGVEFSGQFDLGLANRWSFNNPYFIALTYTHAEQRSDATSTDAESIFSFGSKGNKVPYIPDYQITVGSALEFAKWGVSITATFVDSTFASASNAGNEIDGNGNPDARFGKTDAYKVVDFATHYQLNRSVKLFGGVHNVFQEEYIASRLPHGPRPGLPRTWFVGLELEL